MDTVRLHYLDTSKELAGESLLYGDELRDRLIARLGITRKDGESHCDAWGRHLHEINNLEFSKPYHPAIRDAIEVDMSCFRFMFVLA